MPYTIWGRGHVLGTTELDFHYREGGIRCGWLLSTELGERLLPEATGVASAMRIEWLLGSDPTIHADVLSAIDHESALNLELRSAAGEIISTESIAVVDTEYLLSLSDPDATSTKETELSPEEQTEIDECADESDEAFSSRSREDDAWPRYQVQVTLRDHWAIP